MENVEREEWRKSFLEVCELLTEDAHENVDGMYELIERIVSGKAYLTVDERKMFGRFLNILIQHTSAQTTALKNMTELWTIQIQTMTAMNRTIELLEEQIKLLKR